MKGASGAIMLASQQACPKGGQRTAAELAGLAFIINDPDAPPRSIELRCRFPWGGAWLEPCFEYLVAFQRFLVKCPQAGMAFVAWVYDSVDTPGGPQIDPNLRLVGSTLGPTVGFQCAGRKSDPGPKTQGEAQHSWPQSATGVDPVLTTPRRDGHIGCAPPPPPAESPLAVDATGGDDLARKTDYAALLLKVHQQVNRAKILGLQAILEDVVGHEQELYTSVCATMPQLMPASLLRWSGGWVGSPCSR